MNFTSVLKEFGTEMHRRWLAWHHRATHEDVIQTTPRKPETIDVLELYYTLEGAGDITDGIIGKNVSEEDNVVTENNLEEIKKVEDKIFASEAYKKLCNQVIDLTLTLWHFMVTQ